MGLISPPPFDPDIEQDQKNMKLWLHQCSAPRRWLPAMIAAAVILYFVLMNFAQEGR